MKITKIPVKKLMPYIRNAKDHPSDQVEKIAASISAYGFNVPVLIDQAGEIIAGHGCVLAAKSLGLEKVPCIRVEHLSPDQVKAFRIADNKIGELGTWNEENLSVEINELLANGFDIDLTFLDQENLDDILNVDKNGVLEQKKEELRPYRKTHVLISFNPDLFGRVSPLLEQIISIKGVEYEQGSNG